MSNIYLHSWNYPSQFNSSNSKTDIFLHYLFGDAFCILLYFFNAEVVIFSFLNKYDFFDHKDKY